MDYRILKQLVESFLAEENLKTLNRTFGVEFEMCFDKEKLSAYIDKTTVHPYQTAVGVLRGNERSWNSFLQAEGFEYWVAKYDSSVDPSNPGDIPIEIVTPILAGEAGLAQIKQFVAFATSIGGYVNTSCGGHVHIGAKDLIQGTQRQTANKVIVGLMTSQKFTPLLKSLIPKSRYPGMEDYAKPQELKGANISRAVEAASQNELANKSYLYDLIGMVQGDRYKAINFESLASKGTVEFRIFEGNLNYQTIEERVRFGTAFVNLLSQSEVDLASRIKSYKDELAQANEKGPRTEKTKKILLEIYKINMKEKTSMTDAISRINVYRTNLNSTEFAQIQGEALAAISKYPLYNRPTNLLEHNISIDCRTKSKVNKMYDFLIASSNLINLRQVGTTIFFLPTVDREYYTEMLMNVVQTELPENIGFTPEEFLAKLDVAEAAPYKLSLDQAANNVPEY